MLTEQILKQAIGGVRASITLPDKLIHINANVTKKVDLVATTYYSFWQFFSPILFKIILEISLSDLQYVISTITLFLHADYLSIYYSRINLMRL